MPRFSASCAKISRSTTSSRARVSSSGDFCWPPRAAWLISRSTRALGTGLPLTVATFCASDASGAMAATAMHASRTMRIDGVMGAAFREAVVEGGVGAWAAGGPLAVRVGDRSSESPGGTEFIGREGLDGQRMNALRDQPVQGIIHEAMSRHAAHTNEARAGDSYRKVTAFARAGVAGVQVRIVGDVQGGGRERIAQHAFDVVRADAGRCGSAWVHRVPCCTSSSMCRLRYRPCAIVKTSIRPSAPNSLKLTQAAVEKL